MVHGAIPGTASPARILPRLPHSTVNATPLAHSLPALPPWNTVLPVLQLMHCCHSWVATCSRRFSAMVSQVATALQSPPQSEMAVAGAAMAAGILPDSPLASFVATTPAFTNKSDARLSPVRMAYIDSVVNQRAMVRNGAYRKVHLGPLSILLDHNFNGNGTLRVTVEQFDSLGVQEHKRAGFERTTREPRPTESFTLASEPFTPPTITIDGKLLELTGVAEPRRMLNGSAQTVYVYKASYPVSNLAKDVPIVITVPDGKTESLFLEGTTRSTNAQAQLNKPSRDAIP